MMLLQSEHAERLARAVSRLFGWVYFASWSLSFYPQPLLNWQRRSTIGVSIDFPAINMLGFACYTISTACFLSSAVIREQYAARHARSREPTVRFNDLAFGVHGVILTVLTYSQYYTRIWGFKVGHEQCVSKPIAGLFWGCIAAVLVVIIIVAANNDSGRQDPLGWAWIDVIYTFGYVKLLVTLCKYMPQAWLNYQRKSTKGWSINQILFDLTGGMLSLLQLVIDSALQHSWGGLTGNPVKLGLANISMAFDVVFIVQHYILYRESPNDKPAAQQDGSEAPLLAD